jgi:hypothetical protein
MEQDTSGVSNSAGLNGLPSSSMHRQSPSFSGVIVIKSIGDDVGEQLIQDQVELKYKFFGKPGFFAERFQVPAQFI